MLLLCPGLCRHYAALWLLLWPGLCGASVCLNSAFAYACFYDTSMGRNTWYRFPCNGLSLHCIDQSLFLHTPVLSDGGSLTFCVHTHCIANPCRLVMMHCLQLCANAHAAPLLVSSLVSDAEFCRVPPGLSNSAPQNLGVLLLLTVFVKKRKKIVLRTWSLNLTLVLSSG
jgi:hypothetical protein